MYLSQLLFLYTPNRRLRSETKNLLTVQRCSLEGFGRRLFAYAAPSLRKLQPISVKRASYIDAFKSSLKTYPFSMVYFSVEACLEGVFPHSVSTWRDTCVRVYAPLALPPPPPPHEKKIEQGGPSSPFEPNEGAFELTHGSDCIIGW